MKVKVKSLSRVQLIAIPRTCGLPGSSIHGIFQARVLEWVAISFPRGSSWLRDRTQVSRIVGRLFTVWATREVIKTVSRKHTKRALDTAVPRCVYSFYLCSVFKKSFLSVLFSLLYSSVGILPWFCVFVSFAFNWFYFGVLLFVWLFFCFLCFCFCFLCVCVCVCVCYFAFPICMVFSCFLISFIIILYTVFTEVSAEVLPSQETLLYFKTLPSMTFFEPLFSFIFKYFFSYDTTLYIFICLLSIYPMVWGEELCFVHCWFPRTSSSV